MLLHDLAENWAGRLCDAAGRRDPYQRALTAYAIEGYLAVIYGLSLLLLAAWLTGALYESLLAASVAAVLKSFTGGAHVSTPTRCAVTGMVIFTGIGHAVKHLPMTNFYPPLIWLILLLNIIIVWRYAPVESPGKPLKPRQRVVLRYMARSAVALLGLICILWPGPTWQSALFYGATVQCLNITTVSRRIFRCLDDVLTRGQRWILSKTKKGGIVREKDDCLDRSGNLGNIDRS